MSDENNKKEEKKGGFLSSLSGIARGGSSAMGGASSGMGSAGGLGGLFATKAGIVGLVLGSATIAAGVGVLYNFMSPSSKPVYSPDLFQNSYYQEEAAKAQQQRQLEREAASAQPSTLDMFREQAKKDGLSVGGGAGASGGSGAGSADASAPQGGSADASAGAAPAAASSGGSSGGGIPRLQHHAGFADAGSGGGSGTSIPRMQMSQGLSGGIGAKFQPVYRPPIQANAGRTSGMLASAAARMKSSPKYAVPNLNAKGAYGQAKYAAHMGVGAAYSADAAGSRTTAQEAFSGETSGSGDVGTPGTGAGLGGAGVSNGPSLKGNDPSLNANDSTPPEPSSPKNVNPWQKYEDMAMNSMMWALGMIVLTKILSNIAKKITIPWLQAAFYMAAMATAAVAIFFAAKVIYAGFMEFSKYGQKMMGGIYMVTGVMLMMKAIQALCDAAGGAGNAGTTTTTTPGTPPVTNTSWTNSVFGKGNFLSSMGGWGKYFDMGSLFK